jgi:hypothetical protein
MSEQLNIIGYFLLCFFAIAACGLSFAKACLHLKLGQPRFRETTIDSIAFTAGSISGSIMVFYILLLIFRNGGYPGVVGIILFLSAILQSLTNFGFNLWISFASKSRPNQKLRIASLVMSSLLAILIVALLK